MAKLQRISNYIFISFLLISSAAKGQNKDQSLFPINEKVRRGLTLGVNLEGPIGHLFDNDKSAFSFVTHINLSSNWFFRGEAGFENLTFSESHAKERNYQYQSNGSFLKAGILYDFFNVDERGNNDNIFIGLNYGYALQQHGSNSLTIQNGYWDDYQASMDDYFLQTHWFELLAGPRTELLKNLYMGWTLNIRVKVFQDNSKPLKPYSVPGFGNGNNTINIGFSYLIEYFIPWQSKKHR
ncbi:DUF6048 family protein [Thermophagus sp. OGC60D27]|uniref:DUF6048 family protein n=1 Tax=Thermophagus sp. OGC60D27 TaxID=3458415 RepID=UPI0040377FE7